MAKILIYGAGAVGQYIGGLLQQAGKNEVSYIGRSDHYSALKSKGLKLTRRSTSQNIKIENFHPMIDRLSRSEKFDWVFLTVKAYNLSNALKEISFLINDKVKFLLFQMGVGSYENVIKSIPKERVFIASLTANVAIIEPGVIVETNLGGGLGLSPVDQRSDMQELMNIFTGASIQVNKYEDWKSLKWSALLYEMLLNGVGALCDYTPDRIIDRRDLFSIELSAFTEALKVIQTIGVKTIDLPGYPISSLILYSKLPEFLSRPLFKRTLIKKDSIKVPTLKNDMEKGKKGTEIGFINGAVSRWGKERKVRTPVNDFLTEELIKVVTGKKLWDIYRKKPEDIAEALHFFKLNYVR